MILFLNTAGFDQLEFALIDAKTGRVKEKKVSSSYAQSEKTAAHLEKFLISAAKAFGYKGWKNELDKIIVVSGPGSFTGIRTGIALALGLHAALGIEVFAISQQEVPLKLIELAKFKKKDLNKITQSFEPEYGAEPNITTKKPR